MKQQKGKNIYVFFIHVTAWALFIIFPFILSRSGLGVPFSSTFGHVGVRYAMYIAIFYLNYSLLIDKLLFRKKYLWYCVCNVILLLLLCMLLQYVHEVYRPENIPQLNVNNGPPRMGKILNDLLFMFMFVGFSSALKIFLRTRQIEMQNKELEQQRRDAELKNLKNQLNPHFIFNTLNNIYALIAIDGEKAQLVVLELSNLLRYVLYENKEHYVPVKREIDFVRDYIALMRIRQSKHTVVHVSIDVEKCADCYIAPLLFIPFIENAFKHGINPNGESFINIEISAPSECEISCLVENGCYSKDYSDCSVSGIGLSNIKKQLQLLYPQNHTLDIDTTHNKYSVKLNVKLNNKLER